VVAGAFVLRLCKSSWSDSDSTKAVSIRSIVAFVLPLIFGMALTSVSSRSDVMLLTLFRSAKEVGIYSAAFQIASILAIVLQCVETVILSRLSKSIQDNDVQSLTFFYSSGLSLGYLIGLPLFIAFMIFNKELLAVYGGDFKDAGLCLQVLSVAQIFNLATGSANAILVFSGRTTIVFINSFVVCAIQISLNYLLVPNYGILGASTSFCMAYLTLNLLRVLQVYLFLRVHPFRKIVLFPTIFAAIGCYLLGEFGSYQVFEFSSYEKFACFVGIVILIYGSVFLFLGTSRLCTLFTEVKSVARSVLKV
jgi:O-antigen/teichoic acid export membrane protein